MIAIRNVVCPVDFSTATERQVTLAVDVCRAFSARLILHHNVTDVSVGAAVGWMWHARETEPPAGEPIDAQLRRLLTLVPDGMAVETCITRGAATEGVVRVSEAADADVVVLSEHAGKAEDHASVIEHMLANSNRAVLALHDAGQDDRSPQFTPAGDERRPQALLVPVSLSTGAHPQLDFAAELARTFPLTLHLLHVVEPILTRRDDGDADPRSRVEALIPADLRGRAIVHIEDGEAVPVIVDLARGIRAACIVMGEHTRVPVKRWLKHDTARAVLHDAHCPVWYVPAPPRVAQPLSRFALSDERSSLWGNV